MALSTCCWTDKCPGEGFSYSSNISSSLSKDLWRSGGTFHAVNTIWLWMAGFYSLNDVWSDSFSMANRQLAFLAYKLIAGLYSFWMITARILKYDDHEWLGFHLSILNCCLWVAYYSSQVKLTKNLKHCYKMLCSKYNLQMPCMHVATCSLNNDYSAWHMLHVGGSL